MWRLPSPRSVLERIIRARLVYRQPVMTRIISFEYLNQQLVWAEMSELMLFLLPILSTINLRRWIPRSLTLPTQTPPPTSQPRPHMHAGATESTDPHTQAGMTADDNARQHPTLGEGPAVEGGVDSTRFEHPSSPCPLCGSTELIVPFVALPCQHVFCYYCLRASCLAEPASYCCPRDGVRVVAMKRWRGGRRGRASALSSQDR